MGVIFLISTTGLLNSIPYSRRMLYGDNSHGGKGANTLSLCAITHTYIIFSVFPYAGYFALFLLGSDQISVSDVGVYVGIFSSAFSFGRLIGFFPWKKIRSKYGMKTSLVASLLLSSIFFITLGMSKTFTSAVLSRFAMGLVNGMSGAIKRAVIDQARSKTSEETAGIEEEEWIMSRILTVMIFGCAFAPAVGGLLASGSFMAPNAFGAILCLLSASMVLCVIPNHSGERDSNGESKPLLQGPKAQKVEAPLPIGVLWQLTETRNHILAYTAFSFCIACVDEAMPLYLITPDGGPGLGACGVGVVLSAAGVIAVILQQTEIGKVVMETVGLYKTLRLSSLLANVPLALIPVSLVFKSKLAAVAFIVLLSGMPFYFRHLYFGMIGIATSRTVPESCKDDAARVMTWTALVARAVGPSVAGALFTFLPGNSWTVWGVIAIGFGTVAAVWTYTLQPTAGETAGTAGLEEVAKRRATYLSKRRRSCAYTKTWGRAKWDHAIRKMITVNRVIQPSALLGSKQANWSNRKLGPGVDVDNVPFFILGTHGDDTSCHPHVLNPPLMEALQAHLPPGARGSNYWLRYSLIRDGASLTALESKAGLLQNTILAVEALDGSIFGCFMGKPWTIKNRYEFCGKSFLWRKNNPRSGAITAEEKDSNEEDIDVYNWTGNNELVQLFAHDKLAVGGGGGFGFVLDEQLYHGATGTCETYCNPILTSSNSEGGMFEVANIEVWALTPFLFEADAERSERALLFRKENLMVEGQSPSSQSPWSQFL